MKKYRLVIFFILGICLIGLVNRGSRVCSLPDLKKVSDSQVAVPSVAAEAAGTPSMSMIAQVPQGNKVYAYYFYGNFRCVTCRKIEQYSREAIEAAFADEIMAGRVEIQAINVEEPGNEHFVKDYQLYSKALVLSLVKDSRQVRFKNLQRVWEYVNDKPRFLNYVKDEMTTYMKEL